VEYERSKPGKHGSAKARIVAIGVFDDTKRSIVSPVSAKVSIPIVEKRSAQIISMTEKSVQLMDLENYEIFFTAMPNVEELKSKLSPGLEVEFWRILDRIKIMRLKGST
jgi:translation initiation factor 5A